MKISIVLFALTYILIGNNLNQIARALNIFIGEYDFTSPFDFGILYANELSIRGVYHEKKR